MEYGTWEERRYPEQPFGEVRREEGRDAAPPPVIAKVALGRGERVRWREIREAERRFIEGRRRSMAEEGGGGGGRGIERPKDIKREGKRNRNRNRKVGEERGERIYICANLCKGLLESGLASSEMENGNGAGGGGIRYFSSTNFSSLYLSNK